MHVGDEIKLKGVVIGYITAKYAMRARYFSWRCAFCNGDPGGHYGINGGGIHADVIEHYENFHQVKD